MNQFSGACGANMKLTQVPQKTQLIRPPAGLKVDARLSQPIGQIVLHGLQTGIAVAQLCCKICRRMLVVDGHLHSSGRIDPVATTDFHEGWPGNSALVCSSGECVCVCVCVYGLQVSSQLHQLQLTRAIKRVMLGLAEPPASPVILDCSLPSPGLDLAGRLCKMHVLMQCNRFTWLTCAALASCAAAFRMGKNGCNSAALPSP